MVRAVNTRDVKGEAGIRRCARGFTLTMCAPLVPSILGLAVGIVLLHQSPALSDDQHDQPVVRLDQLPNVQIRAVAPVTGEEERLIRDSIEELQQLSDADVGLLETWSFGRVFVPVGQFNYSGDRQPGEVVKSHAALRRLVAIGPKALPALLAALDDDRPTKFVVNAGRDGAGNYGMMWFDRTLAGNPMNPLEQRVLRLGVEPSTGRRRVPQAQVEAYRIKIGDVCFVAIGQIVGRDYRALLRDHAKTMDVAICSPVHNRKLCDDVRAIWGSEDSVHKVFRALLLDYSTRGMFNGESLDGWAVGNEIQVGAAMRLLYYFPTESGPLIAGRLNGLTVSEPDDFVQQCVTNGVRADDLVDAVGWSSDVDVRAALEALAKRAKERDVIKALRRAGVEMTAP